MIPRRIYIRGAGIITSLGGDGAEIQAALAKGHSGLKPLVRFAPAHQPALPVGEVPGLVPDSEISLTHQLARKAADQAMAGYDCVPDAIVLGVTTGGMARTEKLLKSGCDESGAYRDHALHTVTRDLAGRLNCRGPLITVSTACSSGGAAIALALAMLRSGSYRRVLTGGVDSLCRLTYYGFKSLQIIDPHGARPLDIERRGMSVAEGAGMLLLEAVESKETGIEILGVGLSCDAHHPAQPHPQGKGAFAAMQAALAGAGLKAEAIDYINLHGTGTPDNDRSEARAVKALFKHALPPLSSIKGATGHTLGAAGAIEAVIAAQVISHGLVPANTGCQNLDPELRLKPVEQPVRRNVNTVLSNSFGFGGNNAAVIIGRSGDSPSPSATPASVPLRLLGYAAVTGAGFAEQTLENLSRGLSCRGRLDSETLCHGLPTGAIRRVKRLSHMALALLNDAEVLDTRRSPKAVFFGTGWGCLSETHDFLKGLFESEERFASPTDFIGSVHNAPAGQIALMARATGANLTLSGGDHSFEQALFCAQTLVTDDFPVMVAAADETHERLSPLFDPSVAVGGTLSDGGGALILTRAGETMGPIVRLRYLASDSDSGTDPDKMVQQLGGADTINEKYGLILAGLPASQRVSGRKQLDRFLALTGYGNTLVDYRRLTGEFAAASAVATVFAASRVQAAKTPSADGGRQNADPGVGAALVLGLGFTLSAIEVVPA